MVGGFGVEVVVGAGLEPFRESSWERWEWEWVWEGCVGVSCVLVEVEKGGREPNVLRRGGENAMPYPYPFPAPFPLPFALAFKPPFAAKPECAESPPRSPLTLRCTPAPRLR